ncbi:unnamed protein product [Bursaphelenchus xylophilus]|uniref:(pine wood nematode) hypothetical protein n=1 Tax=Bursaphelenchus xylophilus TaxID=6326 RepID=A0A7I8XQF7_BURXY|nr:unnamed protein product [Bursaphelenchus xylophilus]CAG9087284.1 unnamed protein product [Bursaphelenchus xylophilus]
MAAPRVRGKPTRVSGEGWLSFLTDPKKRQDSLIELFHLLLAILLFVFFVVVGHKSGFINWYLRVVHEILEST